MKIILSAIIITLSAGAFGVLSQTRQATHVKDELLVKFDNSASFQSNAEVHSRFGAKMIADLGNSGWQLVKLRKGLEPERAVKEYAKAKGVITAQPNFYYRLNATPNDPQYSNSGLYGLQRISAPAAWDITTGSHNVVVANIDTGMRLTHEDLAANLWTNPDEIAGNGIDDDGNGFIDDVNGWDFRFNDNDPTDQHGHGTHVGGTIGAAGNNGVGIVGVNWNVRIMAIKIYSATGSDTTSAMLINAYNYVRLMKERGVNIRISNNSYGGCQEACFYDQATKDAIDALGNAGVLNVFAAGNSGVNIDSTAFYPGSYDLPSILNVASSTSTDSRAGNSNYGVVGVDLAAPGVGIYSTTFGSDSSYGFSSGTSMAVPHVSGAAALLAAHHPELSPASLKATLMNNVDQLPEWSGVVKTGGRLNIQRALQNPTICSYQIGSSSINMPTKGGAVTINISAPPNCEYQVKSNDKWLNVMSPKTSSGSGQITIWVGVNSTVTRTGSLTVNGQTLNISQSRTGNF